MNDRIRNMRKIAICLLVTVTLNQPVYTMATSLSSLEINNSDEIDNGIYGLKYNKYQVLATNGESVESFIPKEGIKSKDKFIVIERNKKTINTTPIDISIIDSMSHRTYPGALQLADEDFVNNQPNLLAIQRKPLIISIDLPGMKNDNNIEVENPTYSGVNGAIDTLVDRWARDYSKDYSIPARIQYSETMVHSKSQLSSALNINSKIVSDALGIDFEAISNGEKKVMVAAYKQIFYTVSAQIPNKPSDLFGNNVRFSDLEKRGVSNETPPIMVSNVAYGRTIYVKLETESKDNDVQGAFKALLSEDNNIDFNGKYKDILDNSSFTAVVLGGDSKEHNKIVTKDFENIKNIIKDNAEFSPKNPAYPISYTGLFIKDNAVAGIKNKTEYIETKSQEYNSGKIKIDHIGAYVAQFEILWDEISYDEEGNEILTSKSWDGNWEDKTARFTSVVYIPANATNIRIYARECTGLAWEWWRTIIDEYDVSLTKEIMLKTGGTTLSPTAKIEYN